MRRTAGIIGVTMLAALTACTGGTPDDSGGKSDDSGEVKTEPVKFGSKPVWTVGAGHDDDQPDALLGLEEVYDMRVVGDHVVLLGYDEDGKLSDQDRDRVAIVVLDAETGEPVWWICQGDPLPGDESMTVIGLDLLSKRADITDSGSIVVGYEKETKEADEYEFGVAELAIDSGKLLSSVVASKHDEAGEYLDINGVVGDDVLVDVFGADENGNNARDRVMVLNVATGKKVWSRDDMDAAAMTEDVLLLTKPDDDDENTSYHAVDRDSDKTLWKFEGRDFHGVESFTSEVTVATTEDGSVLIDNATGKELDTLSEPVGGCANSTSLIACLISPQELVSISIDGKSTRFSKVRPFTNAAVTAVSNWIFITEINEQKVKTTETHTAMDAAGNTIDTPGMVADLDKKLAITYAASDEGLRAVVSEISVYKIDG